MVSATGLLPSLKLLASSAARVKIRYTLLSPILLELLRAYVRKTISRDWLFCARDGKRPLNVKFFKLWKITDFLMQRISRFRAAHLTFSSIELGIA